MNIAPELSALLAISVIGQSVFAPFELETPAWRKVVKWSLVIGITLGMSTQIGHWSILIPLVAGVLGLVGHTIWCVRHGIHPLRATPRRKYYQLRGWTWQQ